MRLDCQADTTLPGNAFCIATLLRLKATQYDHGDASLDEFRSVYQIPRERVQRLTGNQKQNGRSKSGRTHCALTIQHLSDEIYILFLE